MRWGTSPWRSRGVTTSSPFSARFGVHLPDFLTTGYRTALLSADPAIHGMLDNAPHVAGIPILINVPRVRDRRPDHLATVAWRARERAHQQRARGDQAPGARLVHRGGADPYPRGELHAVFPPQRWRGIHQGAAIVFFAYIGSMHFDCCGGDEESAAEPPHRDPRWARDLHADLRDRRRGSSRAW